MTTRANGLAVVTGVAGFIGSRLAELLLESGWRVVGIDCFTDYYARTAKESNLEFLRTRDAFSFVEGDVNALDLECLLDGVDVVFHQAAQAGVRDSWGGGFPSYVQHNVLATQRLLEASRAAGIGRFIYASSSSVYGQAERYPTVETDAVRPYSPYGVTKLAAENLVTAYARNFGLVSVSLRYHTVYGPRQRPDMAIHRLIRSALTGEPFPLFAAGSFSRDFTFVDDICRANMLAAGTDVESGAIFNLAGGESIAMNGLIDLIGQLVGSPVPVQHRPAQAGDVARTAADWSKAKAQLGWAPATRLRDGLRQQIEWHRATR